MIGTGGTVAPAGPQRRDRAARLVEGIVRVRELGIVVALVALVVATGIAEPRFVEVDSLRNLVLNASLIAILAVGQTLVVVTRNIDLSVGSVLGLAAFATGTLLSDQGLAIPLVVLAGVALGAGCGLVNGLLVTVGRVPALVATLGTLYVYRGLAFVWTDGRQVNAETLPDAFLGLGTRTLLGVPVLVIVAALVVLVVGIAMRDTRAGRELYAIGSNPQAARLAGIHTDRRVLGAFVLSGLLAGLAGVLFTARFGTVDGTAGTGYELDVVAAAVVGGVAIFGGSGTVVGAALGALVLGTITSSLIVLRVDPLWQRAFVGALLLAAITLDRLIAVRTAALLRRRTGRAGAGG